MKSNTPKNLVPGDDPKFSLELEDFTRDAETGFILRERATVSLLGDVFKKKRLQFISKTLHMILQLAQNGNSPEVARVASSRKADKSALRRD